MKTSRSAAMKREFSGSGPGARTPDGCSVELYRRLPYMGELDDIETELRGHAAALELGCGTGRLCARMVDLPLQDGTSWRQSFTTTALTETAVEGLLGAQGLGACQWLGDKRLWGVARGPA